MGSFAVPHFRESAGAAVETIRDEAGQLCLLEVRNPNAAEVWLQLFDHAAPVVGTTPPALSFYVPALGGNDKMFTVPIEFLVAIKYAITTTPTGDTGPAAGVIVNAACTPWAP
jgi:hypothetical protein